VESVEHIWVPSTAFCIPDVMQEPLGEKFVGAGLLKIVDSEYHFEFLTPRGVLRHNLFDHPEVYPVVRELESKLKSGNGPGEL
jgi:hypothetical protein